MANWQKELHIGDEVTWNDPDEGLCSHTGVISEIEYKGEDVIWLRMQDGWEVEAYLGELT